MEGTRKVGAGEGSWLAYSFRFCEDGLCVGRAYALDSYLFMFRCGGRTFRISITGMEREPVGFDGWSSADN